MTLLERIDGALKLIGDVGWTTFAQEDQDGKRCVVGLLQPDVVRGSVGVSYPKAEVEKVAKLMGFTSDWALADWNNEQVDEQPVIAKLQAARLKLLEMS